MPQNDPSDSIAPSSTQCAVAPTDDALAKVVDALVALVYVYICMHAHTYVFIIYIVLQSNYNGKLFQKDFCNLMVLSTGIWGVS